MSIVHLTSKTPELSNLVKALNVSKLTDLLGKGGPYTVFAPTNDAFNKLPKGALQNLLKDKDELMKILTYHVVPEKLTSSDLLGFDGKLLDTISGKKLKVQVKHGWIYVIDGNGDKSKVTKANAKATNGTVHQVNKVLIPPVTSDDIATTEANTSSATNDKTVSNGSYVTTTPPTPTGWNPMVWIFIALAILIIIAVVVYFVNRSKKNKMMVTDVGNVPTVGTLSTTGAVNTA
jgi:hypothetical protein